MADVKTPNEPIVLRDDDSESIDLFVTVGTDHHKFDRLIDYVDDYVRARREEGIPIRAVCQTGTSRNAADGDSEPYFTPAEMAKYMESATVVVCHGGPATITDAMKCGRVPIVVPRDPGRGEHIDSHQQRFAKFMSDRGNVVIANDMHQLTALIDAQLSEPERTRQVGDAGQLEATIDAFAAVVDRAVYLGERPGKPRLPQRFRRRRRPDSSPEQYHIMLVTSGGGHLAQCWALKPWFAKHERSWVSFDLVSVRSLLEFERVRFAFTPTTRNIPNLIRNLALAARLMYKERPDVIVSTGAGVAVPFFWLSRLFGTVTVYVEVYDRIDLVTMTARLIRPVTDVFLLQWPEQQAAYPHGTVLGALL